MFALKIIVVSSAILNIGHSTAQCRPDEIVEFACLSPTCTNTVKDELSQGQLLTSPRTYVSVVGYNKNSYLIKKKEKLSIVSKNRLRFMKHPKVEHWKYRVNINKNTYEVCELTNQSNEENYDDSNITQINSNTNNAIDTPEVDGEADTLSIEEDEEIDIVSVEDNEDLDESEDELNLHSSFAFDSSNIDSSIADDLVNENLSLNSDKVSNADLINQEENGLNGKTNQNNNLKPTSSQKLENDSSAECTLDSCAIEKEHEKSYATKELNNNIVSPVNKDYSYQQKNEPSSTTKQISGAEKIDNSIKEPVNDSVSLKKSSKADLQDDNNGPNKFHLEKNVEFSTSQQLLSIKKTESLTNEPITGIESQNTSIDHLQDNSNDTEKLNSNSFHQEKEENLPTSYQQSSIKKIEISTEKLISNNPQNSNPDDIQDDNKGSDELHVDMEKNVNLPKNERPPSIETKDSKKIEPITHGVPFNSNTASSQDNDIGMDKFHEIQQQDAVNSDSLPKLTISNHQSQPLPLLEKDKVKLNIKIDSLSSNSIENNSQNDYNTINEFQKQPDSKSNTAANSFKAFNDQTKPESQNISHESLLNSESTIPNNNSVDTNSTYPSPLQELAKETGIVLSLDSQNTASGEETITEKSVEPCMSESEGCYLKDNDPNYNYENIQQKYMPENKDLLHNNAHEYMKHADNDVKSKEFEPKSFVSSFGHPDTCSGIGCLNFNRNMEKTIKSPQTSNSISKQVDPDASSMNTDSSEQSNVDSSILDSFQNWISSPTLNTIGLLKNVLGEYSNEYDDKYSDQTVNSDKMFGNNKYINHSELYFIVMAVVTLLFSLIYYKYQNGTNENNLLTLLAAKDDKLLIIEKELSLLKEQGFENTTTTTARNSDYESLNEHLTKSEDIISSQALRIEKLEQEVEELTESGMEMHTLLSSTLDSNAKNKDKLNALKCKLTESENFVSALTQKNFEKTAELEKRNDLIKSLQITVDELTHKNMNLVEDNAKILLQLEQTITKNTLKESKLLNEMNNLNFELDKQTNALVTAENEVLLSKTSLQEVLSQKFNPADAKKFLSSVKLSAELKSAKQMCEEYKHKLNESLKSNQQHLDHIDVLKSDIVNFEDKLSKLQIEIEESNNKLKILTKFFKEQEKEYLKQINKKSVLYDTKKEESIDLTEHIQSLNQEISNYKSEIQSLKKEIIDQEDSFKIQVSAADKKASDYWISYRQAERKLKEMELETAQLRNKLTMVDKKLENGSKSIDSSKDFEDELLDIPLPTVSPVFTLLDFEPPPPILTNERLPPLGALGQTSSPPVPLSRRHNRSLSPGSPPSSLRSSVFRPLPQRYNRYMNQQNSLGHSVESLDK